MVDSELPDGPRLLRFAAPMLLDIFDKIARFFALVSGTPEQYAHEGLPTGAIALLPIKASSERIASLRSEFPKGTKHIDKSRKHLKVVDQMAKSPL